MFQQILSVGNIQIVNVDIAGQHFTLTVWQVLVTALFFTVVVKFFSALLNEGKRGDDDD